MCWGCLTLILFAAWLCDPALLLDAPWLTELLSGTVGLTVCMCQCSCVCTECSSTSRSSLAPPFVPLSDPLSLSPPCSCPAPPSSFFFPSRLLSRRRSLPVPRTSRPLLLFRNLSLPPSFPSRGKTPAAACGVNCHKACRGRLAVECRKRTKSISHETPPALQARSYSFPPPANTPPSLQSTGETQLTLTSVALDATLYIRIGTVLTTKTETTMYHLHYLTHFHPVAEILLISHSHRFSTYIW